MRPNVNDITQLRSFIREGNRAAIDALLPLVYDRLCALARAQLASERHGHTLNATAFVHESYLDPVGQTLISCESRVHFFAIAAQAMRHKSSQQRITCVSLSELI